MMFALMFSSAITAATIGIAEGAVRSYSEYTAQRVSVGRGIVRTDPYQLTAFGEASAEVSASRLHLLHIISELYDHVSHGGDVSISQRLEFRRSQVRAARRAIDGVEKLFNLSGAGALDLKLPLQRYWRDMHAAGNHICNVAEPIYHGWGLNYFGGEIPPGMFI
jgi:alkylation response protein AidB-like acyl-CoA dehydrogenase